MGKFRVRVVNENGKPVMGAAITVEFGIFHGSYFEHTDANGWTEFDNLDGDLHAAIFYVNGESQGEHSTQNGDTYSFTI